MTMKQQLDYVFENGIEVIVTYTDAGETVKAIGLITHRSDYDDNYYDMVDADNVSHGFTPDDIKELVY